MQQKLYLQLPFEPRGLEDTHGAVLNVRALTRCQYFKQALRNSRSPFQISDDMPQRWLISPNKNVHGSMAKSEKGTRKFCYTFKSTFSLNK